MSATFVPVTAATIESALDLMHRLYTEPGGTHHRQRARRAMEYLLTRPESGGVWFLEAAGELAGYVVVTACFSLEFGGSFGLLDELYLLPGFRGRGLGSAALGFAGEWCRAHGCEALRLEVDLANERALGLYRRAGFETHHRDLMTKWL